MSDPLPHLGPGDLCGGRVFHGSLVYVVALSSEPRRDEQDAHRHIVLEALQSDTSCVVWDRKVLVPAVTGEWGVGPSLAVI